MTTIVTALYDIGRGELKGIDSYRPFSKYLSWFKNLLSINAPMVVFVDQSLASYVKEHRPENYQTKVVIRKFQELKAYKYHDRIQNTIHKMHRQVKKKPNHFINCPEFSTAKYQTVIYSKFDLLLEVSEENPFDSNYFFWLDAGTFYDKPTFDFTVPWPDPLKVKVFGDKFLLPNVCFDPDQSQIKDKRSYVLKHKADVCAYMLGGTKTAISKIHKKFWREVDHLLKLDLTTNEQMILQILFLKDPQDYYLWYQTRNNYPDLKVPECFRMIPYELAVGTFIPENYPINKDIKVLAVATKEVNKLRYQKWEQSAKHFGYNYEIVGKDKKWNGFKTKIMSFVEKLQEVTEPYVILCDIVDLFFCAPSDEMLEKFLKMKQDLIVGGESNLSAPGMTYDYKTIKRYFLEKSPTEHAFPNSGFIMGKTSKVREMMNIHASQNDDQTACYETIYENKMPLVIDYYTQVIGNIPKLKGIDTNRFVFDKALMKYKNIHSGEYPCAIHFPGGYFTLMDEFFINIFPHDKLTKEQILIKQLQSKNTTTKTANMIWSIVVTFVIIALIIALILFR